MLQICAPLKWEFDYHYIRIKKILNYSVEESLDGKKKMKN